MLVGWLGWVGWGWRWVGGRRSEWEELGVFSKFVMKELEGDLTLRVVWKESSGCKMF